MKTALLLLLLAVAVVVPAQQLPIWLDLSGDWRISSTDEARFADPAFDDSSWEVYPMPARRLPPFGTYWIRTRFTVPAGADTANLALTLGSFIEVYEVFLNGQRIGSRGEQRVTQSFVPRPKTFAVTPGLLEPGKRATLALRLWRPRMSGPNYRMAGGVPDRGPYLLTSRSNIPPFAAEIGMRERERLAASAALLAEFYALMFAAILLAWLAERGRTELIWLGLMLLGLLLRHGLRYAWFIADGSHVVGVLLGPLGTLVSICLVALALSLAGVRMRWALLAVAVPTVIHSIWNGLVYVEDAGFDSYRLLAIPQWISASVSQMAGLFLVARRVLPRGNSTATRILGGVLAVAIIAEVQIQPEGTARPFRFNWSWAGLEVASSDVFAILITVLITALVLARLLADRREKARLSSELEAARTVQQLLLPASTPANLEAVYLPAAEVGGDFWHVFDNRLIVVGDVSGKGLKAAMIVSLVTGALRNRRSDEPGPVLAELNAVLLGSPGFVTCCVARLDDGSVTLANAGHPSPYLDGRELELPPGLPLGIAPEAHYDEVTLPLTGTLTFLSDGVPEAANASGELLGFDRTRAISTQSAQEIAEAARAWGQTDDITVVTLRRSDA